jgi:hypothetical protein
MNATPPLRLYGVLSVSLAVLVAQLGLRAVNPHPLRAYLVLGTLVALVGLLLVVYLALSAKSFAITGSSLKVRHWWQSERSAAEHPLSALSSVAFSQTRLIGRPIVEVRFASGASVRLPVRYQGAPEMGRFLFGQLGQNVEAERGAT